MRDIVFVLMEGSFFTLIFLHLFCFASGVPSSINYTRVVDDLFQLPGVRNVHSLHIWSLSLQKTALSVHIAIGEY
jgi:Co/Zn/Cd efflux system component